MIMRTLMSQCSRACSIAAARATKRSATRYSSWTAVPGWPSDIPLPVDPQWKREYAATVRRLVRDGVDVPLATLFVHVARKFDSDAQGVERARSASEAFLFRRLESLPETAGRFALNAELPIPFDGWGNMEVGLFDSRSRLVIELDGGQHLANADAYRRDRRKDALLQEHADFVLRFLVEDVGKRLDHVLDAISGLLTWDRGQTGKATCKHTWCGPLCRDDTCAARMP